MARRPVLEYKEVQEDRRRRGAEARQHVKSGSYRQQQTERPILEYVEPETQKGPGLSMIGGKTVAQSLQDFTHPKVEPMTAARLNAERPKLGEAVQTFQKEHPLYKPPASGFIDKLGKAEQKVAKTLGLPMSDKKEFPSYYERMQQKELHLNTAEKFVGGLANTALFGIPSHLERAAYGPLAQEGRDSIPYKAGEFAGYTVAPGAKTAEQIGAKLIPQTGRLANIGRNAVTGAIMGGANQAAQEGVDIGFGGGLNAKDRLMRVGEATAFGGGLGAGVPILGAGVKKIADKKGLSNALGRAPGLKPNPLDEAKILENPIGEAPKVTPEAEAEKVLQSVKQPRMRDRVYNFLDEQEKAARQRMAKRRGNLNSNPLPEWGDMSIIMAAKMGKGTIKLADFTEEAVKEFGESIRGKAPQLFNAAKEELMKQERRASKEGKAAEDFNNSGTGDASTFAKKINYKPAKKQSTLSQKTERIRTQFIDDLAPLEGLEKRVTGKVASAENSLYKSARLTKGIPERANMIVQSRLNPLISSVEKAGYNANELGMYALAKHAKDVNAAGYKSGFTNKEIEDVLAKYENNPVMEEARKGLVQITRDTMHELVDSGVVSKELQDTLNERWKNYIPLFRALDDEALVGGRGAADKLANIASPVKKLAGSEKDVIDPLENLVKNIFQSVNAAERNKVGQQLAKLAVHDTENKFIRKLGPDEEVGRKNVVNVKENGENVKYEVEPQVYKALLNLDKESSNLIVNILAQPASLLRSGATLTPEFSLRNPIRDVLTAFVTSKSGFNPFTDFFVGLGSTIKKGELYKDWVDNLGAYGNVMSMDRNVHREALNKVLKQPVSKKFVNVINGKGLIHLLRYISDTTESATKVGEYRAALRKGQTKQEAAYRSRDLMDFARAGSGVRQANKMVAFLNANIQGKSKLIRAIKENPAGTITRSLAAVTVPTVGIYFWNHTHATETQKNTIDEAPDWLKNSFWLIAVPGTDMVARIPKPFDLAPIFANLPERILKHFKENDPKAFDGYAKSLVSSFAIPTQISGLMPLVEGMANYSFFRGGSIIPKREENLEFKDQYDPIRTTETAKLLAAGANKLTGGTGAFKNFSSPRVMDNTIQGLTAGLGTYATSAVDSLLQGKVFGKKMFPAIIDRPESPQKRLEQRPLVKSFLVDPLTNSRSLDDFYNERDKLTRANGSAGLNDKKFEDSARLKVLNRTAMRISKIGKQIREIEASKELSPSEKRFKIEPLLQERNTLAKQSIQKG